MSSSDLPSPQALIYATIMQIPLGQVASYGQVAERSGLPRRARYVGRVLKQLSPDSPVPWHRVVAADGSIKTGSPQTGRQASKLREEGVFIGKNDKIAKTFFAWQ